LSLVLYKSFCKLLFKIYNLFIELFIYSLIDLLIDLFIYLLIDLLID